jgi:mono/diheme cytochrome c family protein
VGFRKSQEWLDVWLKNPEGWKHGTLMPNFYLKEDVRKSLVLYLSSLKGQGYAQNPPWNQARLMDNPIKRGEVLYQHLGCVGCHGNAGVGGYPNNNVVGGKIPSLIRVADGYSKDELKDKIRKGVAHSNKADPNGPEPLIHMPEWGQVLKDDELDSLADYLISLKPQTAEGDAW